MFAWFAANAATSIISAVLLAAVAAAIRSIRKRAKSGQCMGCDCGCDRCNMGCQQVPNEKLKVESGKF